jgi:hypothetical protein
MRLNVAFKEEGGEDMRIRINLKADGVIGSHNEQIQRDGSKPRGLKTKTGIKGGGVNMQHNQTVRGLRVKSNVKAGGSSMQHNQAVRKG